MVDPERITSLNKKAVRAKGPVVYWMSRDQRTKDNWALHYSIDQANQLKVPLYVVFILTPNYPGANLRHYSFMLKALQEVQNNLSKLGIAFFLLKGEPANIFTDFILNIGISLVISDFDPLNTKQQWKKNLMQLITIPFIEIDAHNIVPCRVASNKQEFGAYTIRPKINRLLKKFLIDYPALQKVNYKSYGETISWKNVLEWLNPDKSVIPVKWIKAGEQEAITVLNEFLASRLNGYAEKRNDPLAIAQSNLSPYLHFGQISAQRVAIEVIKTDAPPEAKAAFLEELIVRRELSDNYCFYNPNYSNVKGFHPWATLTHRLHKDDEREFLYLLDDFELAVTHDPLWNAAQMEMVKSGKRHGYMRMYWAKKILEWTNSPEQAMEYAIYLNDKFSLEGRDPNGCAGIAWSIGGVHDRAWAERSVFGKIRYMNYNGCRRKFDVDGYISMVNSASFPLA